MQAVPSSFVAPPMSVNAKHRNSRYSRYNRCVGFRHATKTSALICMILSGSLLLTDASRSARLAPGWLRIEAGLLSDVQLGACPHTVDLGGDDCLITPGFIDTHLHLPQFDAIGIDGLPLLEWLEQAIFPAESRWADPAFAAAQTQTAVRQLLLIRHDQLLCLCHGASCGHPRRLRCRPPKRPPRVHRPGIDGPQRAC